MIGFCDLDGTGIAPVSKKKTAVKRHFYSDSKEGNWLKNILHFMQWLKSFFKILRDYDNYALWLRLRSTYDYLTNTFIKEFDVSKTNY